MTEFPKLRALTKLTKELGVSRTTVWRFRKLGWLKTVQIAGKAYVTDAAWTEFVQRAEQGDFANVCFRKCSNEQQS